MKNPTVDLKTVIEILNGALEADRDAINELMFQRVPCNSDLANHHLIQVRARKGEFSVGALGLINGLFGDGQSTFVYAITDDEGKITHFQSSQ